MCGKLSDENYKPERELEWRQGGELWEQGKIH